MTDTQRTWLLRGFFFTFAAVYLWIFALPAVKFTDEYHLFVFTWNHWCGYLKEPGGGVTAVASVLAQLFRYPAAGVGILALLTTAVQAWIQSTTGIKGILTPLTYIPSLILLMLQLNVGDHLCFVTGMAVAVGTARLHVCYRSSRYGVAADMAVFTVCYCFAGSYALLGIWLVALLRLRKRGATKRNYMPPLLLFVFSLAVPSAACHLYPDATAFSAFSGGLPEDFFSGKGSILKLMYAAVVSLIVCHAIIPLADKYAGVKTKRLEVKYITAACCIILLAGYARTKQRSLATIEMVNDMQEKKWNDVLIRAKRYSHLSRAETVMVNLALCATGKLSTSLFDYPQQYASQGMYPDLEASRFIPIIGSELYDFLGLSNYTYRWAMEGLVMETRSPSLLKKLLVESIVREEYALAEKYLYFFRHSLTYRGYASMVEKYLNGEKNEELDKIIVRKRSLLPKTNTLTDEFFEFTHRLSRYADSNPDNHAACEYLLACCLLDKKITLFVKYLDEKYPPGADIPVPYQQALSIYRVMLESKGISDERHNPDPDLLHQFDAFNTAYRRKLSKEQAKEEMAEEFGNTYWYYYVLTDLLNTITN